MEKFEKSFLYFENRACKYFPCHTGIDPAVYGFNCQFCRCPYYYKAVCPGIEDGSASILVNGCKDCTNCYHNHLYSNREEMSLAYVTKEEM
jgi:Zn-finger protein